MRVRSCIEPTARTRALLLNVLAVAAFLGPGSRADGRRLANSPEGAGEYHCITARRGLQSLPLGSYPWVVAVGHKIQ